MKGFDQTKMSIIAQIIALIMSLNPGAVKEWPVSSTAYDAVPNHDYQVYVADEIPLSGEIPSVTIPSTSLTVYFIDVGQSDSALLMSENKTMLIDGGNVGDSNLIYSFLNKHGVKHLDYIVSTHAHEDHVGGLSGALNYATVGTAFSPVTTYDSRVFNNFVSNLDKQGVAITVPKAGDSFKLGSSEVKILAPVKSYKEPNNTSIVLKVTHGEMSFLFTGDAEREAEQDILAKNYDLSATVLKVGHHGSETSSSYAFLREIMPEYAVILCGQNNSYGHPHEVILSRLRDADVKLYRTDMQGDITFVSDGKSVEITTQRNANIQTNTSAVAGSTEDVHPENPSTGSNANATEKNFIGNVNSLKFHTLTCRSLPLEKNRIYFNTRNDAIKDGYSPCGICNP